MTRFLVEGQRCRFLWPGRAYLVNVETIAGHLLPDKRKKVCGDMRKIHAASSNSCNAHCSKCRMALRSASSSR